MNNLLEIKYNVFAFDGNKTTYSLIRNSLLINLNQFPVLVIKELQINCQHSFINDINHKYKKSLQKIVQMMIDLL